MRTLALAAAAALLAAAPPARGADEPIRIELELGQRAGGLGIMPICDDLTIVSADNDGVKGLKLGTTLCSYDRSGGAGRRQVYRIVVIPPRARPAPPAGAERAATPPERER